MWGFIKRNLFLIVIFLITLLLGFITFLTFIEKSFISLSDENLKYLLFLDISLLLIFFTIIFLETKNSIKQNINVRGSIANRKYIVFSQEIIGSLRNIGVFFMYIPKISDSMSCPMRII